MASATQHQETKGCCECLRYRQLGSAEWSVVDLLSISTQSLRAPSGGRVLVHSPPSAPPLCFTHKEFRRAIRRQRCPSSRRRSIWNRNVVRRKARYGSKKLQILNCKTKMRLKIKTATPQSNGHMSPPLCAPLHWFSIATKAANPCRFFALRSTLPNPLLRAVGRRASAATTVLPRLVALHCHTSRSMQLLSDSP